MAVLAAGAAVAAAFHAASPAAGTASGVAVLSSPAAGHIFITSYNLLPIRITKAITIATVLLVVIVLSLIVILARL